MTDKKLAQLIKVNPSTLHRWKQTKPELLELIKLGLRYKQKEEEYQKQNEKFNQIKSILLDEEGRNEEK